MLLYLLLGCSNTNQALLDCQKACDDSWKEVQTEEFKVKHCEEVAKLMKWSEEQAKKNQQSCFDEIKKNAEKDKKSCTETCDSYK